MVAILRARANHPNHLLETTTHFPLPPPSSTTANAAQACSSLSIHPSHMITLSKSEVVDYRAIQRTFDGAYARTALGQLCYAVVILRLFQSQFFYIAYCLLAIGFVPVALYRYRLAVGNEDRAFSLKEQSNPSRNQQQQAESPTDVDPNVVLVVDPDQIVEEAIIDPRSLARVGAEEQRYITGRSFVTAGNVVAGATVFVGCLEVSLLILIMFIRV
ncbi:hypothetical protein IE53DRAFT_235880 [Violaceomyces palustris]|uniref:Uncharacterized protein n=1 Tax=Violaceomyces palustris TaxID=1673888 RepID=A0ACD0NPI3_9BASI|nr:hypothetical protein IE53DRAFT_235880 [Violaceomyces palustris]